MYLEKSDKVSFQQVESNKSPVNKHVSTRPRIIPLKQKGHKRYGGAKKGMKYRKTIAREKAREVFELAQLKKWERISDAQAEDAVKDQKAREYTINQVIGKAKETTELRTPDNKPIQIQLIIKESMEKIYGSKDKKRSS